MSLTPQQKEFYAQMENTFMTPGWGLMVQGWREEQEQLPTAVFFNAKTIDDVRAAKVRFGLLDELINLPETIAAQKTAVEESDGE